MDTTLEHLVFRMMDMTADNAVAPLGLGIRSKIRLKTGNRGNSLLDLVLDDRGKRIILFSPFLAGLVPDIIELQQKILDDHAYIFCSFLQMNMISRSNVKNYTAHACDYYQVTADLDIN